MGPASGWLLASAALALVSLACEGAPAPTVSLGKPQDLYSRDLNLPSLARGSECPVSASQSVDTGPSAKGGGETSGAGYGTWPAFMSGGWPMWFGGQVALLLINHEYEGPLIVRGHQLDGPGGMPLEADPELGSTPVGDHGVEFASSRSNRFREWVGRITRGISPGCYGLQVDGFTFTSQIVLVIQAGPLPPA
jgi:hypothetical protein